MFGEVVVWLSVEQVEVEYFCVLRRPIQLLELVLVIVQQLGFGAPNASPSLSDALFLLLHPQSRLAKLRLIN